jgi:hypothetical protein
MSAQDCPAHRGAFAIFRGDIMSNPNKPFHNLSFDPAEMVAVIEASDLACQTLQNIGQLEVDREVIAEEFCEP